MTKETLMKILNEKSMSFSEKEIHDMMDAELEKSPEEMDTHFVDLCLDVLDGKYGEGYYVTDRENTENADKDEEAKKAELRKKRLKISRNLLIAAVVTTILTFSATAGAKAVFVNADENLVTYITNHFNIDLKQNAMEDDTLNIVDDLHTDGIENVVLPSAIVNDKYAVSDYAHSGNDSCFNIENQSTEISGSVNIFQYDENYEFSNGTGAINDEYFAVNQAKCDITKVLVLESKDHIAIVYAYENTEYTITLDNCDSDTAMKIAETIGVQK